MNKIFKWIAGIVSGIAFTLFILWLYNRKYVKLISQGNGFYRFAVKAGFMWKNVNISDSEQQPDIQFKNGFKLALMYFDTGRLTVALINPDGVQITEPIHLTLKNKDATTN